ncbi:sensor domain-containing protein [Nocardia sp. NPDC127579]|uniref:sensor domain-containing protein n=1 Tax=Nocardia sp. NPDC127579 TaxID=3345402 RepID=UPI0036385C7E
MGKLARGRMFRVMVVAATMSVAACSPGAEDGPSSPGRSSAAESPVGIESYLLGLDEIRALRTRPDIVLEWVASAGDKPARSLPYGPVEPARCNSAVGMEYNLQVEQWTQYRSSGLGYRKEYWISQSVASFQDEATASEMFGRIKDSVAACGNSSGLYPRERTNSGETAFPFSVSLRDFTETSARWTYVIRGTPVRHDPSTTEVFVGVARNVVLHVSVMELADAAPLSDAMAQAITRRVQSK